MSGRAFGWLLLLCAIGGLAWQSLRWRDRLEAGKLVRQVQVLTVGVAGHPEALERLLPYDLAALKRAGEGDGSVVEVPLSRGSLYLLLHRPEEAAKQYRRAIALEPHAEIFLHLGDALLASGKLDEARKNFTIARLLNPWLTPSVPGGVF